MSFTTTPLYGGAITVDLPSTFADTSTIREVPDHQEVYLDQNGYSSIVIEILEHVNKPTDEEALQFHFADLVDGTGDTTTILNQETFKFSDQVLKNKKALSLTFIQTPQPPLPTRKTPEFVFIHMLLLRLPEHGTDVMVTINVPHYSNEYERAKEGEETELMKSSWGIRDKVLESLRVVEWGLFEG